MTKSFITVYDPIHCLLRMITRETPLNVALAPGGFRVPFHKFQPEDLPCAYYTLAVLHSVGGMPLECLAKTRWRLPASDRAATPGNVNYFDAVFLDRRCSRDIRLKLPHEGPGLVCGELLTYGTGTLRARNDDPAETLHRFMREQYPPLRVAGQKTYASLRALHRLTVTANPQHEFGKETYDSTNLIYGDAFGELEQLWERRADIEFLDQIASGLSCLPSVGTLETYWHPPVNIKALHSLHLQRSAIWKTPPKTGRALLRRLDYLLSNTKVDTATSLLASP